MHFDILIEDTSGKAMLEAIVPQIIGADNTFKIHSYKGIGHIPKNLNLAKDPQKRILLDRLPRLLRGFGRSYPKGYPAAVIVVCDLDKRCLKKFRQDLLGILDWCNPKPETRFCIAVEEGEAWLLGDIPAVIAAYPKARHSVLKSYVNDSICGTWECLADAIYPGGSEELATQGYSGIGMQKMKWAINISRHMHIADNRSPSFIHFREKLVELLGK